VRAFLQESFGGGTWQLTLPHGWGGETYFAQRGEQAFFVKLGVHIERYQAMACLGLTPPVLASGCLPDGTPLIVQPRIAGREPERGDYRDGLQTVAEIIRRVHHSPELQRMLPLAPSPLYRDAGLEVLADIQSRWQQVRSRVSDVAGFVDEGLQALAGQVAQFEGQGLVAAHNDICNANWLLTPQRRWYLVDLEAMALGDPALDIGATLWWYYPPARWPRFLELTGHAGEAGFAWRMRVRMALHCLHILLPRPGSFDRFDPDAFTYRLVDFRAALHGNPNPQMPT
jgi:hypothetical protein